MPDGTDIVEVFLTEPDIPVHLPEIEEDAIKVEHISQYTNTLLYKVYQKWLTVDPSTLPSGNLTRDSMLKKDQMIYVLDEFIEIQKVKDFCEKNAKDPKDKRCWITCAMFHIIPINIKMTKTRFLPMRMTMAKMYETGIISQFAARLGALPQTYVMTEEDMVHQTKYLKYQKSMKERGDIPMTYEEWRHSEGLPPTVWEEWQTDEPEA